MLNDPLKIFRDKILETFQCKTLANSHAETSFRVKNTSLMLFLRQPACLKMEKLFMYCGSSILGSLSIIHNTYTHIHTHTYNADVHS